MTSDRPEIRSDKHVKTEAWRLQRDRAKDVEQFDDRRKEDSGSATVDALEFAELSTPWHHIAIRRIDHRGGEHRHRQGHDTFGIQGEEN